jgi:hypothetical protein
MVSNLIKVIPLLNANPMFYAKPVSSTLRRAGLFWLAATLLMPTLSSCEKDNGPVEDTEAPVISLSSPSPGSVFSAGAPIDVVFRITENDELHTWDIELWRASDMTLLTSTGDHEHTTVLDVSAAISYSVGEPTDCVLRILAEDHNGNVAQQDIAIRLTP